MKPKSIALIVYRDRYQYAGTESNYKALAEALTQAGFNAELVGYHDSEAQQLEAKLESFTGALVWVNPIMEQGANRHTLDNLLRRIASKGVYVSTHPDTILKIGTKKVLFTTRDMDWGGDTELYPTYADFEKRIFESMGHSTRILKQYRGDGGKGIFKVWLGGPDNVRIVPAAGAGNERILTKDAFLKEFEIYFQDGGLLVNQRWADSITNGMVRCYLTGSKVSGFGYQESVALCTNRPISPRYYFSEDCGLFRDLKQIMESKWVPQLQKIHAIPDGQMPLLWDIDLFINDVNNPRTEDKYTLCEINVSCVSPFPPSCIGYIVQALTVLQ